MQVIDPQLNEFAPQAPILLGIVKINFHWHPHFLRYFKAGTTSDELAEAKRGPLAVIRT
jgi:hypothetical protein